MGFVGTLARGFTNFYVSQPNETGAGVGPGILDTLATFSTTGGASFLKTVTFFRERYVESFVDSPGGVPGPLGTHEEAAARIAKEFEPGGCARAWGAHGVGRLHGIFYILGFRPDGALVAEDAGNVGAASPPRIFLVQGGSASLAEKLMPLRQERYAAGGRAAAAAPITIRTTLLSFRGRLAYAIAAMPEDRPVLKGKALAALQGRVSGGEVPAASLPKAPVLLEELPALRPLFTLRAALSPNNSNAPSPNPSPSEAVLLAKFTGPTARVPPMMAPGSSWTLRRMGYTEAPDDNPNRIVTCVSTNGMVGGMEMCAHLEPTVLELLKLLGDSVRMLGQRPRVVQCDAPAVLPRLRDLLLRAHNIDVMYYPPPSPEEVFVNDATNPDNQ